MHTEEPTTLVRALRRLRWPLAIVLGLIFAIGRFVESALLGLQITPLNRTADPLIWGMLAAIAVWVLLSWAAAQEQRSRLAEAKVMADLKRSNATLELLYEINQRIASSATLDAILDYAISLPGRLLGAQAATLVLLDEQGAELTARGIGLGSDELATTRASFALGPRPAQLVSPTLLTTEAASARFAYCVVLPLVEQGASLEPLGWIEAYLEQGGGRRPATVVNGQLDHDGNNLLITVVGELAEALIGARRRAREIESVTALEGAITAERTRIAHDLHDGVAQSLAFMRMRVDLWEDWLREEPERLRDEFTALKANLRTQIEELRRAIFALRPVELSQLGFEGALRRFVADFADQQGWDLDLKLGVPYELPHVLELAAFRIVQEALTNTAKHGQARSLAVSLRLADGGLEIVVVDDGRGFEFSAQNSLPSSRLGLRQMRERAQALDGRVTIISQPGAGTQIRAWFPIVYARRS